MLKPPHDNTRSDTNWWAEGFEIPSQMKEFDSNTREERMAEVQCHRTERWFLPPRMLARPVNRSKNEIVQVVLPRASLCGVSTFRSGHNVREELDVRVEGAKRERRRWEKERTVGGDA
jgi:hypothetical protein